MKDETQPAKQGGLNPKAKAFVPKPRPAAAPAVPVPAGFPPGFLAPAPGNPAFPPQPYPGYPTDYYQMYPPQPQQREQEPYPDEGYGEEELKDVPEHLSKREKKEKKRAEAKKEPKKEQPPAAKKEPKKKEPKKVEPKKPIAPKKVPTEPKVEGEKAVSEELKGADAGDNDEGDDLPSKYSQVDEKRAPVSIVFIGHVDVGKSTICGSIMVITEKIDMRTIKKYEQEAKEKNRETWWLAYVMDINEDERARGKTVEVGRATFVTDTKRYTIYDAPGHQNYVPNMIMGTAMADFAGFVISAKKGEYESGMTGQTLEHMLLAKSLGVQKLIMIINKMDEPSVRWSKERYDLIKKEVSEYLVRYGFNVEKNVYWIPLSGLTGANIMKQVDPKQCSWYKGPTLMELLDTIPAPVRDLDGPVRIPVLDKLKDRGTDIFGKVASGSIQVGSQLVVMPYKHSVEVTSIENTDDQLVPYAKAGENIKFRIKGLPSDDFIYKGCLLCSPDNLCPIFQTFLAEVRIVSMLKHKPIISNGYQCVLHLHTLAEECTIAKLLKIKGPKDKEFKEGKYAREDDLVQCQIVTKSVIAAEKFEVRRYLGRFTLRDENKTIAIGTVQKYIPAKDAAKA